VTVITTYKWSVREICVDCIINVIGSYSNHWVWKDSLY